MRLDKNVEEANSRIKDEYLKLVVDEYKLLFRRAGRLVAKRMKKEGVPEIEVENCGINFRDDGHFYNYYGNLVGLETIDEVHMGDCVIPSVSNVMDHVFSRFKKRVLVYFPDFDF